jgi:hypothetical protein
VLEIVEVLVLVVDEWAIEVVVLDATAFEVELCSWIQILLKCSISVRIKHTWRTAV